MSTTWLIVTNTGEAAALGAMVEGGLTNCSVLALGSQELAQEAAYGSAKVCWVNTECALAENYAASAVDYLVQQQANVVFGYATPAVRTISGLLAAQLGAAAVSNTAAVSIGAGKAKVEHLTVDNKVIETLDVPVPACLLADTQTFQAVEAEATVLQAAIEEVSLQATGGIERVEINPVPPSGVETAEYVVGVGRGVNTPELFSTAKQLAEVLGAELSGSMPGVRDFGNFAPDASYVGLSGVRLNCKIYFALGISGNTAHLVGLLNAGKVVCINTDECAQLFDHSDYGIVGDIAEVAPALANALR